MNPQSLRFHTLTLALAAVALTPRAAAATLDDIQFWTGSGLHRAALVIDWKTDDTPSSLVWGFRWDGEASGMDMLLAVVAADSRLFAHLGQFDWGTALLGVGYDLNHDGAFAVEPGLSFEGSGLSWNVGSGAANDSRTAVGGADLYREGWNTGFWSYHLRGSSSGDWEGAVTGAAGRSLADGVWDGYSFAPGFVGLAPSEPVAALVPEPGMLSLLAFGSLILACTRPRRS
ncbi:MAG: hypothetical protein KF833_23695 [Verrucomicrobiae bacterium]|nr:hypothetical protein [Verrucomicrobiae bacterium]